MINKGKAAARKLTQCSDSAQSQRLSLFKEVGQTNSSIHQALDASLSTIARVRQIFVEQGLDAALNPPLNCVFPRTYL